MRLPVLYEYIQYVGCEASKSEMFCSSSTNAPDRGRWTRPAVHIKSRTDLLGRWRGQCVRFDRHPLTGSCTIWYTLVSSRIYGPLSPPFPEDHPREREPFDDPHLASRGCYYPYSMTDRRQSQEAFYGSHFASYLFSPCSSVARHRQDTGRDVNWTICRMYRTFDQD